MAEIRFNELNEFFILSQNNKMYFNGIYLLVTQGLMKERRKSHYLYPECLEEMIIEFANMYLHALNLNQYGMAPLPWNELFTFKGRPTTHLLLGLNAHISYDLPLSLNNVSKRLKQCSAHNIRRDYFALDDFFISLTPKLNDELKRLSSYKFEQNRFRFKKIKESFVIELLTKLRKRAWDSYLLLQSARTQQEFDIYQKKIESQSFKEAVIFRSLNLFLPRAGY
jgi:hypothetical protein